MTEVMTLSDCMKKNNPFDEEGYGPVPFISIDRILNEQVLIEDVRGFENDKGAGAFVLLQIGKELAEELEIDGDHIFICTHSTSLCGTLNSTNLQDAIANGVRISTSIVKRKSTKSDRTVYAFE